MTTPTQHNPIELAIRTSGLPADSAEGLRQVFSPVWFEAREIVQSTAGITVASEEDADAMQAAREARLRIRRFRLQVEDLRKRIKADALARTKAIDAMGRAIMDVLEPEEQRLQAQEEFAARAAESRKREIIAAREELLRPYVGDGVAHYQLGEMSELDFEALLAASRVSQEQRIEAIRRAEEERARIVAEQQAEAARIRQENERLRAERAAHEERARVEREARERAEAEAAEAARIAAAAPDRTKLQRVADQVRAIDMPEMSTLRGQEAARAVEAVLIRAAEDISQIIERMNVPRRTAKTR